MRVSPSPCCPPAALTAILRQYGDPPTGKFFAVMPYVSAELPLAASIRAQGGAGGRDGRPVVFAQQFNETVFGHVGVSTLKAGGAGHAHSHGQHVYKNAVLQAINRNVVQRLDRFFDRILHSPRVPAWLRDRLTMGAGLLYVDRSHHPVYGTTTEIEIPGLVGVEFGPRKGLLKINLVWANWLVTPLAWALRIEVPSPTRFMPSDVPDWMPLAYGLELAVMHPRLAKILDRGGRVPVPALKQAVEPFAQRALAISKGGPVPDPDAAARRLIALIRNAIQGEHAAHGPYESPAPDAAGNGHAHHGHAHHSHAHHGHHGHHESAQEDPALVRAVARFLNETYGRGRWMPQGG
jgi:hypothetical protein